MEPDFLTQLRIANVNRAELWNANQPDHVDFAKELLFRSNEMGGECGEAQDAVKKYVRFLWGMPGGVEHTQSTQDIADELADILICADRVAEALHIDLEKATREKFNKTSDKHGFDIKL